MARQSNGDGGGCFVLLVMAGLLWWSTRPSDQPRTQAEAQAAAMSESGDPPTAFDGFASKVNLVRGDFNEDRAGEAARELLSGETYEATVGSGDCTDDCSGHEAGWRWAQEGNDCGGGESDSFDQGCEALAAQVEERVESARAAYEAGDDTFAGS